MAYNLPRFMSREEWEELSDDNLYWLEHAGKWIKFFPSTCFQFDLVNHNSWAMVNFDHPDNVFKRGQESLYVYGKRIHSDYRNMYGVP